MLGPDERGEILERLPAQFADRTRDEVTADGDAVGVRVTPVLTPAEVLANEHVVGRATFVAAEVGGPPPGDRRFLQRRRRARPVPGPPPTGPAPTWPAAPGAFRRRPAGRAALPLAGLRVLELGTVWPRPRPVASSPSGGPRSSRSRAAAVPTSSAW